MRKDFENWNNEKKGIHNDKVRPHFYEREVWFCSLGDNTRFEQDGTGKTFPRPVLIIKKFNNELFWCIPLTTKKKEGIYYHNVNIKNENQTVILSQLKVVDAKRLQYKIDVIKKDVFEEIKRKIRLFIV